MRQITFLFLLLFLIGSVAAPQQPAPAPTFRARTRLVQVDVIVRDKKGPVTGLTQDDFTLLDDGSPQRISVFSVKSKRNPQSAVPLPPGTISNRVNRDGQPPATSTVLLIDRMNTPVEDQRYANAKIVKFLETRGSQDKIGIYTFGKGIRVVQDLTDDPERISGAINRLDPQNANRRTLYTPGPLEQSEPELTDRVLEEYTLLTAAERVLDIKQALEAIANHLAKVPGRKSLIWVTGSLPLVTRTEHATVDHTPDMKEAARVLNDANVALYAVDARGLIGGFGKVWGFTVPGLDTMNTLAGLTGGRAFYVTNGIEDSIRQAVEDSELIYTLGFYPSEKSQNGDWHGLRVTVARHGVDVRYREAYLASKGLAEAGQRRTLNDLVRDPLDATEIGVLAETARDPSRPESYAVRVSVDLHDVQLTHQEARWTGALTVSLYVEGSKAARQITRKIEIPDDQLAAALEQGIVVNDSIGLPAPSANLRVVVQDNSGRTFWRHTPSYGDTQPRNEFYRLLGQFAHLGHRGRYQGMADSRKPGRGRN